ncbi:MAG: hypothetical protein EAZ95_05650 [Bacteroidetes bacterium]|nr:MAG: hypothetical protein EAZ95_05650 [Bacteroidota bacterium]
MKFLAKSLIIKDFIKNCFSRKNCLFLDFHSLLSCIMTNIARLLALAFFALLLLPTLACINTYKELKSHLTPHYFENSASIAQIKRVVEEKGKISNYESMGEYSLKELEKLRKEKSSHTKKFAEVESDYAATLCHVGKAKEALAILERLIQKYPNEYNIVANLGTTYELVGQNEKALQYIKKGLELNKESHAGSEWIHVKILEAKIAIQTNSNWLKENEILGKEARETAKGNDQTKIKQLIQDLGFQLFERTQFIQPKDAMVGDLIIFLGDLYKQIEYYEYAIDSYKLAEKYTVSKPEVLQASVAFAEQNKDKDKAQQDEAEEKAKREGEKVVVPEPAPKEEAKRSPLFTVLVLAGLAVLVGGVWLMYFRSR